MISYSGTKRDQKKDIETEIDLDTNVSFIRVTYTLSKQLAYKIN